MVKTSADTTLSKSHQLLLVALGVMLVALSVWLLYATLTSAVGFVLWDFYVPWYGVHGMLQGGINPYGEGVTSSIGWHALESAAERNGGQPVMELGYPLYILVLIGPLTYLPLPWAQALWFGVLESSLFVFVLLAPRAIGWRPPGWLLAFLIIVVLGMYHTAWAIFLGQISIVVAALIAVGWWGLRMEYWVLAGACLALSTVKPQMVFLFVPGVLLWAAFEKHWRVVSAFAITMGMLFLLPMLWQPTWPLDWLNAMRRYTGYPVLPSPWLAGGIAVLLLAWTAHRWWVAPDRRDTALGWALGMLLVTTMLIAPRTTYVNQLPLLIPLFFVFRRLVRSGIVVAIGLALVVVPWALDLLLPPSINCSEHMIWQHRMINPILPVGLTIALLALSPRIERGKTR